MLGYLLAKADSAYIEFNKAERLTENELINNIKSNNDGRPYSLYVFNMNINDMNDAINIIRYNTRSGVDGKYPVEQYQNIYDYISSRTRLYYKPSSNDSMEWTPI